MNIKAGVILGCFEDCGPPEQLHAIVKQAFGRKTPILGGVDIGHTGTNLTLPIGLTAELDTQNTSLRFKEPAVSGGSR